MKAPTLETLPMYCVEYGDCLYWAQGTNGEGYPQANIDGKTVMMRRWIFRHLMGKELASRQPIVSRCGHKLCVTPACLHATTMGAVLRKAYRDGVRSTQHEYLARLKNAQKFGMAKLTPDQVLEIRALSPDVTHTKAAEMYGVGWRAISDIRRGQSWRHQAPAASVFSWRPE